MAKIIKISAIYLCVIVLLTFEWGIGASLEENCNVNEFQCFDGGCVINKYVCDRKPDCSDGSDESAMACIDMICNKEGYFKCDGSCVPNDWFCDGEQDCDDGADEPERCDEY